MSGRGPQSDADALAKARLQDGVASGSGSGTDNSAGGNRNAGGNGNAGGIRNNGNGGKDRRDMASDDLVMGRFKKRQRSGFK